MKEIIETIKAPAAIGPYSQAVKAGGFVFVSGQLPVNAAKGEAPEGIEAQTKQCLDNIKAVLRSADLDMNHIVKTTIFLKDMGKFVQMNEVYASYFNSECPARSTVEVSRLPKDMMIEIEAIAKCE